MSNATLGRAAPLGHADVSTVVIYVRDLLAMTAFYRDTLGLSVREQTEHYVELAAAGGAHIALHAGRDDGDAPRHWFVEFRVPDIETVVERLRARGVRVGEISEREWGKEAGFEDPEGNQLELEQPAG